MAKVSDVVVWVLALVLLIIVIGFAYLGYRGGYPHRYAYEAFGVDLILLVALLYGLYQVVKSR